MLPLPHGFFRNFYQWQISYRYENPKKILASNFKWFSVYGIFKEWQIDDDKGGCQEQQFLR